LETCDFQIACGIHFLTSPLLGIDHQKLLALLEQSLSSLQISEITQKRYQSLVQNNALSRQEFDEAYAQYLSDRAMAQVAQEQFEDANVEAPFDGIVLNREDLKSPNPVDDQELYRFLLEYLDSRVLRAGEDLSAAVRSLLLKLIPTGKFSVNVLADQLGMHRRTLQRRLNDAGLSYAELLDDCRSRMARRYLLSSNLPMSNLAHMLGYSDQSAFNHAFRRWHGMTPSQWCEQPLEQQTKDPL